jgi:hypothetical protein
MCVYIYVYIIDVYIYIYIMHIYIYNMMSVRLPAILLFFIFPWNPNHGLVRQAIVLLPTCAVVGHVTTIFFHLKTWRMA